MLFGEARDVDVDQEVIISGEALRDLREAAEDKWYWKGRAEGLARALREINKTLRVIVAELAEMNGRVEQQILARFGGPGFSLRREEDTKEYEEGEIIAEDSTPVRILHRLRIRREVSDEQSGLDYMSGGAWNLDDIISGSNDPTGILAEKETKNTK